MTKEDTIEILRTFLPKYLTPELQENLFKIVKEEFPFSTDAYKVYSEIPEKDYYYQGDALVDIPFSIFHSGSFQTAFLQGIIGSNTCDISPENERLEQPNIQFFAIYNLREYLKILEEKGASEEKISAFQGNLKANIISNLFFLPEKKVENQLVLEESFVRFDNTISLPISLFQKERYNILYAPEGDRLFSFSNYGFYLFLIKLSVHYCRFREGVFRND
jgi:hypothetical protein